MSQDTPEQALLTPLALRGHRLSNRLILGAHITNFGQDNTYTPRHRAYYAERAAGGAGLIVLEAMTVHPLDWPYEHIPFGYRPQICDALASTAADIRAANDDTRVLAGLTHFGGQSAGLLLRQSPWAPSPVPDVASRRIPRPMEAGEIAQVREGFHLAARHAATAGLDGVEVQAGQQSLLRQFLSPLTNHRQDAYGGGLPGRARLLLECLAAVRSGLGPAPLLGLRLCGDEYAPWGGLTPADAAGISALVLAAGGVDYLSIQMGGPYTVHMTLAPLPATQGEGLPAAKAVRDHLAGALPVFAEGCLEDPTLAGQALREGSADAAVMTRALISDPLLPRKLAGEVSGPHRPHVAISRYYQVMGNWNRPLSDLANPRAGKEALLPAPPAGQAGTPVLVAGGGPAGMEAALVLAGRGFAVTLREAGPALGGLAARLATGLPGREAFGDLCAYYQHMLDSLGVRVETGQPLREDSPDLAAFHTIVVATGAKPGAQTPATDGSLPCFTPRDLLAGVDFPPPQAERPVLVLDREGGYRMGAAVEWLLARGHGVQVLTEDFIAGRTLVESGDIAWFQRVAGQGVLLHTLVQWQAVRAGELMCTRRFGGAPFHPPPPLALVTAELEVQDVEWFNRLAARHPRVVSVGDARAPRLMGEAIQHAHRTALTLAD